MDTTAAFQDNQAKAVCVADLFERINELEAAFLDKFDMGQVVLEIEARYRAIFEATGTATIIVEPDTTVCLVNAQFEELSGFSRQELQGKRSWTEFICTEDLPRMLDYHQKRRIDPGAAPRNYDCKVIDRFGAEREVFATVDMIPGTKQSVISMLDISDLKQMERKLREGESRYRTLVEHTVNGVIYNDSTGRVLFMNSAAEKILGATLEEMQDIRNLVSQWQPVQKDGLPITFDEYPIIRVLQTGQPVQQLTLGIMRTGSADYTWIKVNSIPQFRDNEQVPYQIYTTLHDITTEKRAEQKLLNYQNQLRSLAKKLANNQEQERSNYARILHDGVGQNLATAQLQLQRLKQNSDNTANNTEVNLALEAVSQAIRETRDLTAGLSPRILYDFGLKVAIETLLMTLHRGHNLRFNLEHLHWQEPQQQEVSIILYRAVQELLHNTVKHAQAEQVYICLIKQDRQLRVIVEDDGVGFDADQLFHGGGVFSSFGLLNVRERIYSIGGTLKIESSVDSGTSVVLEVPDE